MKFKTILYENQILSEINITTLNNMLKNDDKRTRILSAIKANNASLLGPKEIVDQQGNKLTRSQVDQYFRKYGIYDITSSDKIQGVVNTILNYYFS